MKLGTVRPTASPLRRIRRLRLLALFFGVVVVCGAASTYLFHQRSRPSAVVGESSAYGSRSHLVVGKAPPDRSGMDPSVRREFGVAEEAVRLSPRSGRRGEPPGAMLCAAYGFRATAGKIFARAEEFDPTEAPLALLSGN